MIEEMEDELMKRIFSKSNNMNFDTTNKRSNVIFLSEIKNWKLMIEQGLLSKTPMKFYKPFISLEVEELMGISDDLKIDILKQELEIIDELLRKERITFEGLRNDSHIDIWVTPFLINHPEMIIPIYNMFGMPMFIHFGSNTLEMESTKIKRFLRKADTIVYQYIIQLSLDYYYEEIFLSENYIQKIYEKAYFIKKKYDELFLNRNARIILLYSSVKRKMKTIVYSNISEETGFSDIQYIIFEGMGIEFIYNKREDYEVVSDEESFETKYSPLTILENRVNLYYIGENIFENKKILEKGNVSPEFVKKIFKKKAKLLHKNMLFQESILEDDTTIYKLYPNTENSEAFPWMYLFELDPSSSLISGVYTDLSPIREMQLRKNFISKVKGMNETLEINENRKNLLFSDIVDKEISILNKFNMMNEVLETSYSCTYFCHLIYYILELECGYTIQMLDSIRSEKDFVKCINTLRNEI